MSGKPRHQTGSDPEGLPIKCFNIYVENGAQKPIQSSEPLNLGKGVPFHHNVMAHNAHANSLCSAAACLYG